MTAMLAEGDLAALSWDRAADAVRMAAHHQLAAQAGARRSMQPGRPSRAWPNAIVGTRSPEGCVGRLNEGLAGPN